jgi:putative phage-type endonuclease
MKMKRLDLKQDSKEWHNYRKKMIGASDASVIMELNPWRTPYQLWQEKLGLIACQPMNEYMKRGKDLESVALQILNAELQTDMQPIVFVHDSIDYMMASMDGYDLERKIACEIKCPTGADHETALQGKIPEKYMPQLQHQMEVCELDWIYYFSYNGIDNILLKVYRNEKYIKNLKAQERIFWQCLDNLECPKLIDRDFIERRDDEWKDACEKWIDINAKISQLCEEEKSLRNSLIQMSNNKNTMGYGVKLSKIIRKGNIQYDKIPELKNVDLEEYRKDPIEYFKISAM